MYETTVQLRPARYSMQKKKKEPIARARAHDLARWERFIEHDTRKNFIGARRRTAF